MRNKLKWGLVTIVMVICFSMGYFLPVSFSQQGMSGCFDVNNPPDTQYQGNWSSAVKQKCGGKSRKGIY